MSNLVLLLFLVFFFSRTLVETALLLLNLRHARAMGEAIPASLVGHITPETMQRSRAYTQANGRFTLVHGLFGAGLTLGVLLSGFLPALADRLTRLGLAGAHLFVLFLVALFAVLGLADLPFGLYQSFTIETRFGFNRLTWRLWLIDRAKGLVLGAGLGVPLLYASYGFMSFAGDRWWLWMFAFLVVLQVFLLWFYPTVIAPLFNKFVPLPDGDLKQRLENLARDTGFRNRGLYVMDASRRSGHSNAYFTGLFRPRIVLFDTLVEKMTVDEAAAVLAHEIGHYKGRHIQRRLLWGLGSMLVMLFVLSKLAAWPPLFQAFGFAAPSFHAALALLSLGGGAFTFFFDPFQAWLSRRNEYQADRFSVVHTRQPEALKSALIRLGGDNLSNPTPHPWYSAWHHSHPTLLDRLNTIDTAAKGPR